MRLLRPQIRFAAAAGIDSSACLQQLDIAELDSLGMAIPLSARNARRNIERIHTVAVYYAALHAMNLTSAYQLEKSYAQEAKPRCSKERNWGNARSRQWDRWSRGESTIASQMKRGNKFAIQRLAAIERRSPTFSAFVRMPFWRYLDPAELLYKEIILDCSAEDLCLTSNCSNDSFDVNLNYEIRRLDLSRLLEALTASGSRYTALCALWRSMRSCVAADQITSYLRLYGVWLSCREALRCDPILGKVAGDLYRHTNLYFRTLEVTYT